MSDKIVKTTLFNKELNAWIDENGEVIKNSVMVLSQAKTMNLATGDLAEQFKDTFFHVRNDCSASGGVFKMSDTVLAKSFNATLITCRMFPMCDPFVKTGEMPNPQDWAQILFIDNDKKNLKSTLIKTRSLGNFHQLLKASIAMGENPVGMNFVMRFADDTGTDKDGKPFKYKFLQFEKQDSQSEFKTRALEVAEMLETGKMPYPSFDN